jgi:hypothetical protein
VTRPPAARRGPLARPRARAVTGPACRGGAAIGTARVRAPGRLRRRGGAARPVVIDGLARLEDPWLAVEGLEEAAA